MLPTVLQTYKNYENSFSEYIEQDDIASAVRVAKAMLKIIDTQLPSEKNDSYIEYFKKERTRLNEFIANSTIGISASKNQGSATTDEDDQIKATDWFSAEPPKLTLNDVAGLSRVKDEILVNVLAPLSAKYAPIYKRYRKDMGLQLLLFGCPRHW